MITRTNAAAYLIVPTIQGLDNIQVFFADYRTGCGQVVVASAGRAWTAFFNAMGDKTIKQFFLATDTPYITGKLARTLASKAEVANIARLVDAAKEAIMSAEASDVLADNSFLVDEIYGSGDVVRR